MRTKTKAETPGAPALFTEQAGTEKETVYMSGRG
jgi:hypothetical protein